jgi:hypothetical protein
MWKLPPVVKAFEAMGALADGRIVVQFANLSTDPAQVDGTTTIAASRAALLQFINEAPTATDLRIHAKCTSSSLDKQYDVSLQLIRGTRDTAVLLTPIKDTDSTCFITEARHAASDAALFVNDNGAMFQGYVGYPAIGLLLALGLGQDDGGKDIVDTVVPMLKGVPWKEIAKKHKNNWDMVVEEALDTRVRPAYGTEGVTKAREAAARLTQWLQDRVCGRYRRGALVPRTVQKNGKRSRDGSTAAHE